MEKTSSGLQENVAGLLCYLFWVISIVFLLIEKDNKTVRFHALQSICLGVAAVAVWIAILILTAILGLISSALGFIATIMMLVFGLGMFVIVILLLVRTYQGQLWKLPVIGDMAAKWAGI
ncbi:MAG: DUF4870 domain-containing protein [Dehalococcoidia bacterium]|nr:DUF4870 domain-containing protein [Dehalococcoidia bacterium]